VGQAFRPAMTDLAAWQACPSVHGNRLDLRGAGPLPLDAYEVYRNRQSEWQTCLAHLIRRDEGIAERRYPVVARFSE
jgi:hypothetical protein